MKKIEKLTPAQIAKFPEYVQKWTDIGLSTQPADRPRAEATIREMYKQAGLAAPKIVWCGSPLSQGLAHAIVNKIGAPMRDSVWASVRDSVWDSVWHSVWHSVQDSVWDSVWHSVWHSVGDSVWDSVRDSAWSSVRASVQDSVGDSVWDSAWDSVRVSVQDSVRASVQDSVWDSVRASVQDSVGDSVEDSAWSSVRASVQDSVGDSVEDSIYGCHDVHWLSFYDFFGEQCGLETKVKPLHGLMELAKSAGWALPHKNICWVSERPSAIRQEQPQPGRYRLHCDTGPAMAYPDGWKLWYIHGVRVTEQIVMHPETLTVKQISKEPNSEVRRVMVERYGYGRYLAEAKARVIDECPADHPMIGMRTAKLLRVGDLTILDLLNSTPEPDGSIKRYQIPIRADAYDGEAGRNCIAASASTWRKRSNAQELAFADWRDYAPGFES